MSNYTYYVLSRTLWCGDTFSPIGGPFTDKKEAQAFADQHSCDGITNNGHDSTLVVETKVVSKTSMRKLYHWTEERAILEIDTLGDTDTWGYKEEESSDLFLIESDEIPGDSGPYEFNEIRDFVEDLYEMQGWEFKVETNLDQLRLYAYREDPDAEEFITSGAWVQVTKDRSYVVIGRKVTEEWLNLD